MNCRLDLQKRSDSSKHTRAVKHNRGPGERVPSATLDAHVMIGDCSSALWCSDGSRFDQVPLFVLKMAPRCGVLPRLIGHTKMSPRLI